MIMPATNTNRSGILKWIAHVTHMDVDMNQDLSLLPLYGYSGAHKCNNGYRRVDGYNEVNIESSLTVTPAIFILSHWSQ